MPTPTEQVCELRDRGLKFKDIGKALGYSDEQVRGYYRREQERKLRKQLEEPEENPVTLDDLSKQQREREAKRDQDRIFKQLLQQKSITDTILDGVLGSIPKIPWQDVPIIETEAFEDATPQTALLMLSDLHIGSVARPEETGGFGNYDYAIFRQRLESLRRAVKSIARRERAFCEIEQLVVASLGDIIDGMGIFPSQGAFQDRDLSDQFVSAVDDLSSFLVSLLDTFESVYVPTVVGNHGRVGRKGENPKWINWDYLIGKMLERRLESYKRIQIEVPKTPFMVIDIEGFRFLLRHGDEIKSWGGIPWYGLQRSAGRWANIQASRNQSIQYMLSGHLHQAANVPYTGMEAIINGSFIGTNEFSIDVMESLNPASQWFLMVHPRYGVGARYKVDLDSHRDEVENAA